MTIEDLCAHPQTPPRPPAAYSSASPDRCWLRDSLRCRRWNCQSGNIREVRTILNKPPPRESSPRRASLPPDGGAPPAKRQKPAEPPLDLSEPDPLAGRTVLHYACAPNPGTKPGANLPVLRKLFDHGAERFINRPSSTGDTPLMVAARRGDAEAAELLIEAGADVKLKNLFGDTALHVACRLGHAEVVQVLLQSPGINVAARNCLNKTPADISFVHRIRDIKRSHAKPE